MEGLKIGSLLLGLFLILPSFYAISFSHGVSVACMMEYDKGGAPAVFESLECPHWKPSSESLQNYTGNCQFATLQGHRKYQEDRIACDLNMKIPFLGKDGLKEVTIGIVAIFDGHGGKEASEMASKLLFDYLYLHTLFNTHTLIALHKGDLPASDYESLHLELLKEALSQTLHDIDSKFTKEALKNNFLSGSTANVVLLVDGKILVANVGDSKALLCSEKTLSGQGAQGNSIIHLSATELTKDQHPDRDDERARIEAAGGSVIVWGVPRVNGMLAMSRSIGDVSLKKYGVIAVPEFTGWRHLTANDRYLVVASDGLFESLTPQDISDLIWAWESHFQGSQKWKLSTSCLSSASLAECIVKTAYKRGSNDNISAIVVPLR